MLSSQTLSDLWLAGASHSSGYFGFRDVNDRHESHNSCFCCVCRQRENDARLCCVLCSCEGEPVLHLNISCLPLSRWLMHTVALFMHHMVLPQQLCPTIFSSYCICQKQLVLILASSYTNYYYFLALKAGAISTLYSNEIKVIIQQTSSLLFKKEIAFFTQYWIGLHVCFVQNSALPRLNVGLSSWEIN